MTQLQLGNNVKAAIAYTDGSGNSARIQACAAILYVGQQKYSRARLLPPHTTNNVGEYNGILQALALAQDLGVEILDIFSDSQLIVNQIAGTWRCNDPELSKLRDRVWREGEHFHRISIGWIPRTENQEADTLCRETIKAGQKIRASG